jgi:DNA-binding MarR family transcriptional regulator
MTAFAIVSTQILSDSDLTRLDTSIFIALKSHARPGKPLVWPSRTRLARLAHCSLSAVSRSLKRLVLAGWIAITRTGRANRVTVFDTPQGHIRCDAGSTSTLIHEETSEIPPYPPLGDVVVIDKQEAKPEAVDQDQDQEITPDQAAFLIAFLNVTTGSRLDTDAKPTTRLINRRLKHYSADQIKIAIAYYFGIWKGTPMEPHARNLRTVLAPTRIEHAISETARANDQAKAQSQRIWKPDPVPKKADQGVVRQALGELKKLLT